MNRRYSLSGRRAFAQLYREGSLWRGAGLRIRYLLEPREIPLFAISTPRSCGIAVKRNRLKRIFREALRSQLAIWPRGRFHLRLEGTTSRWTVDRASEILARFRGTLETGSVGA